MIMYLAEKKIVSLPQAKIFINGVLKVPNQAIRQNLHGVIMKILVRVIKGVGCQVYSTGGSHFGQEAGQNPCLPVDHISLTFMNS